MRISTTQKPLTKSKVIKLIGIAKAREVLEKVKGNKVKTIYSERMKKIFK